jgi:hypothetical protein
MMSEKIEKYLYKSVLRNPNNAFSDNIAEKYINPEYVERLEQKRNTLIDKLTGLNVFHRKTPLKIEICSFCEGLNTEHTCPECLGSGDIVTEWTYEDCVKYSDIQKIIKEAEL